MLSIFPPSARRIVPLMFLLFALALLPSSSLGQSSATQPAFAIAQLLPVAVQPGVKISDDYVHGLSLRIAQALEKSKQFTQVIQSADISTVPTVPTLRIGCTVIRFVPGSRVKREFIGYGAGATKITVHVVFTDAHSNKVLLQQDVKGLVWIGGAIRGFGNPKNAQNGVSKDIEKLVRKYFASQSSSAINAA